jgi:heme oxygenase-like protein
MFRGLLDTNIVSPQQLPAFLGKPEDEQRILAKYNRERLAPGLGEPQDNSALGREAVALDIERSFVEAARREIAPILKTVPSRTSAFIAWFENLQTTGPGQNDPLFPWLATRASYAQMCWFLEQEVAGEAGFDDLVAMAQVKMPARPKLEMARNYWDEMGRGEAKGMHGPMLENLAKHLKIEPKIETTAPESLGLGNMMVAFATNRMFAFHAVGALGVIEMTAPGRAALVTQGLNRLGVPKKQSHYFALHAVLDVKHSAAWNSEVLAPLVEEDPRRARAIAEGALLRLWCGKRCFERYRSEFGLCSGKKLGGH